MIHKERTMIIDSRFQSALALIGVDDRHDRETASNGHSRLGAYLRQPLAELEVDDLDPRRFAAWCFGVATPPVMTPGYLWWRAPLVELQLFVDPADGALVVLAELVHRQFRCLPGWATWERDCLADEYREPARRPRVLPRLTAVSSVLPGPWPRRLATSATPRDCSRPPSPACSAPWS
jgi:hypothetical protein